MAHRRRPSLGLRISTQAAPAFSSTLVIDSSDAALSVVGSDVPTDDGPSLPRRNMKKLSLNISGPASPTSSIRSGFHSLRSEPGIAPPMSLATLPAPAVSSHFRRPSVVSLLPKTASLVNRQENVDQENAPYADGPIEILPGIWLGSEDNVHHFSALVDCNIRAILNVAKEVNSPFDTLNPTAPVRGSGRDSADGTYYPPHLASGRPAMHYLKLIWSHGQQDLVTTGFAEGMAFTDAALERGDGVLIHCQCGISRSATMVIALVMRAAATRAANVPEHIWSLNGMQPAYDYVKQKSSVIGPNMSLIYQLLDYEKKLQGKEVESEKSSIAEEEEDWARRREMMEAQEDEQESLSVIEEARALDRAMEDRMASRRSSASSLGMGAAWRNRYGFDRKRTCSVASTNNSVFSEDLIERDEEHSLLGVGGGFTDGTSSTSSTSTGDSPDEEVLRRPLPSAPAWKTSFSMPPVPTPTTRATFELGKGKRRPPRLLPTVPCSPTNVIVEPSRSPPEVSKPTAPRRPSLSLRQRCDSRKPAPAPLYLRDSVKQRATSSSGPVNTPSQTLFVFPPSPTLPSRTPSTMTLSNMTGGIPFPAMTPRVSTFRTQGRTRSFIGITAPATPTTAFSKVDVRGFVQVTEK